MHSPSSHLNHPKELPHKRSVGEVSEKIIKLVWDESFSQSLRTIETTLSALSLELEQACTRTQDPTSDYQERLKRSEDELEAILKQDPVRKELFERLLASIDSGHAIKKSLFHEVFFDRLMMLWPRAQKVSEPVVFKFYKFLQNPSYPPHLKIRDCPTDVRPESLLQAFQPIQNEPSIRELDLGINNLWRLTPWALENIFPYLWKIKSLDLNNNYLSELSREELVSIFSNLTHLGHICLKYNQLHTLDGERLWVLFSYLNQVKSMDLASNFLWALPWELLEIIFSHLWNIRNLRLTNNDLFLLEEETLDAIFSQLKKIKRIDLLSNEIHQLDDAQLKAIFSHLENAQEILIENKSSLKTRLELIFPHLRDKFSFVD